MARKFEKLLHKFNPEYNEAATIEGDSDFVARPQAYFRGASQIPGAKYNVGFQVMVRPYFLDRNPHIHNVDEYLIYMGVPYPDPFSNFDAKIRLVLGEGAEAEEYIITEPTIIRIPAGVVHCPMEFVEVRKPVFFQAALMQGMFGAIGNYEGKEVEMYYNGPGMCIFDANKKCDSCRKCLSVEWSPEQ
ncbi:MAG: hypothetical protein LBN97_01895 [Oscillospiraceae bacterium]|jgi:hypothetical protein|nr:hypothetical protein [Oscillospiraceae bacterium]